jgi:hypothetical protein
VQTWAVATSPSTKPVRWRIVLAAEAEVVVDMVVVAEAATVVVAEAAVDTAAVVAEAATVVVAEAAVDTAAVATIVVDTAAAMTVAAVRTTAKSSSLQQTFLRKAREEPPGLFILVARRFQNSGGLVEGFLPFLFRN